VLPMKVNLHFQHRIQSLLETLLLVMHLPAVLLVIYANSPSYKMGIWEWFPLSSISNTVSRAHQVTWLYPIYKGSCLLRLSLPHRLLAVLSAFLKYMLQEQINFIIWLSPPR
jgi:hypothetical protein